MERATIAAPTVPKHKYALPRESLRFFPRLASLVEHPRAWTWPGALADPSPAWVEELRRLYGEPLAFPASMSPQCGLMLHGLILNLRPRVTVEVGSFVGASTLWIGGALLESGGTPRFHAFDDFGPIKEGPWRGVGFEGDRLALVRGRVERAGLAGLLTFHPGDSGTQIVAARESLRAAGGVDVAFIDGDHGVEGATRDFWAVEPVLNTGGYVILHDTYPEQCGDHPGPRYILDHVNSIAQGLYERCELHLSPLNYGFGLLRRIG
jgi:predicted O-methyltransferase YrrM